MAIPILAPAEHVTAVADDPVDDTIAVALDAWRSERDARRLRRALLAVLTMLDEAP